MIELLLEFHLTLIFIGKTIFTRIHYILENMQISKLVMKKNNSSVGNKTTKVYKQNPVLNGYEIVSELEDVLKRGYYKSLLGYDNVDWFVDEIMKLEKRIAFFFKKKNKERYLFDGGKRKNLETITFVGFVKEKLSEKVRDHCYLTGKYRSPAQNTCKINVTQDKSKIILFMFHKFSNYDCHLFFKKLADKRKIK